MNVLDDKQKRLIGAWLQLASGDEYARYMSTWVGFNALCYALFANEASRRRPDLKDDRGLNGIEGEVPAAGRIEVRVDGRVTIRIDKPGTIRIDIRDRYTEDLIFTAFAREFQPVYERWLDEPTFSKEIANFLEALRRPRGVYVINMLKVNEHSVDGDVKEMAEKNVVVPVTDRKNLRQLVSVLYQVRNNMFHGEKIPGDLNDDRIVGAARPVLEDLVKRAYHDTTADRGGSAKCAPGSLE